MLKRSYFFLFIALFLTVILILYQQLGGFKTPVISFIGLHEYHVAGIYYEGKITGSKWESLFYRMRDLVESDRITGTLTIVWYNQPEKEEGFARAFIGIQFEGNPDIPSGLEVRTLQMAGVIRATMKSHVSVMPSPQKVSRLIREWAARHGYELQDILIEMYPEESAVYSEIPVEKKKRDPGQDSEFQPDSG
jgi:hypothetical protein